MEKKNYNFTITPSAAAALDELAAVLGHMGAYGKPSRSLTAELVAQAFIRSPSQFAAHLQAALALPDGDGELEEPISVVVIPQRKVRFVQLILDELARLA